MKKSIIILTLFLLSLATAVSADTFNFNIMPIRDQIDSGESAQFLVTIESNLATVREFRIYSLDIEWDVPSEVVKAYPLENTTYKLVITPSKYVEPGKIYGVKLNFKDMKTEEILHSEIVQINVKSSTKAVSAYRPSVSMTVDMPTSINPKESAVVKVRLENQNLVNLSDIVLKVSSEIAAFEAEQTTELIPLGKKIIEFNFNLDPLQAPGQYKLTFDLMQDGETIESSVEKAVVQEVKPPFSVDESETGSFFKTVITKKVTSSSNVDDTQTIKIPTGFFKNIFTSTEPDSKTITEDGQRYLALEMELKPGESKNIVVVVNYRIIIYLLLIALAILFVYLRYRSPLNLRKGVSDVGIKEGGISELKVTLELKNTSTQPIKNATVTDYIPNIGDLRKEFGEGTIKPSRIFRHRIRGTVIKWELGEIAPGEDLLISYTMKSKLSIVGEFKVPRAKVTFKKKGREITAYSNQVGVST